MNNIKIFCNWGLKFDFFYEKQIELYVDEVPNGIVPPNTIRFLFLLEPPEIMDLTQSALNSYTNGFYNYLLTHNQELLDRCSNSVNFPLASTWIKDYNFPEKEYAVSTLVGGKRMANGHIVRQRLWDRQNEIKNIKTNFFISGNYKGNLHNFNNNRVLGSKKDPLFDSQFTIIIENTFRRNWFTEKIIDALQTKTVPLYLGCPNIEDWFDAKGMFICNDETELINICNTLTSETYEKMLPFVEENYKKSMDYASLEERLKNIIKEKIFDYGNNVG